MISEIIQKKLIKRTWSFSTAESCTGGNIAHQITLIPGSSDYFKGSVVAYSNAVKENVLSVNSSDIEKYGVVSETVACQMADGVRELLKTDFAVSTTGIAGPTGGNKEKPIGTVWIGVSSFSKTFAKKFRFDGNRTEVIEKATQKALEMLVNEVSKEY